MAQTGQLRGRINEEQLINLLEQVCATAYIIYFYLTVVIVVNAGRRSSEESLG